MRTLKYAILGLLNQKSMTGYDLMQEFESALNEFWHARHSQIYPELKKLTEEGLVSYKIEISGTALEKKVYTVTEAGRADFLSWLAEENDLDPTPKEVFRLKIFFSGSLDRETRLHQLHHQLSCHRSRLEHLRGNQQKFTVVPDTDSPEFGDYLVLMSAVMREEMNCSWLEKCIEMSGQS